MLNILAFNIWHNNFSLNLLGLDFQQKQQGAFPDVSQSDQNHWFWSFDLLILTRQVKLRQFYLPLILCVFQNRLFVKAQVQTY